MPQTFKTKLPSFAKDSDASPYASLATPYFADYLLSDLPYTIFSMRLAELTDRINDHIAKDRFTEAFILKSLYVEGVITSLSCALSASLNGLGQRSLVEAMQSEEKWKKFYEEFINKKLTEKIKILRGTNLIENDTQADFLYTWNDKYRNWLFHNFAELMLHVGEPDEFSKKGLAFMERFTKREWFKKMEDRFVKVEDELLRSRIKDPDTQPK